jgi:catechol 2,3-dioxygenase-like lactoylglutathione lyase family enzyme
MALTLNHYSIRTTDLDACRSFYEKVLGLTVGPRPEFPFPGLWMYAGDHAHYANAVVHIIGIDRDDAQGLQQYLGDRSEVQKGTGTIDHIAFFADGLGAMLRHLQDCGVSCRERTVPGLGLHQVFLEDPNGVTIELNYPAHEKAALDAAGNATTRS